MSESTPTPHKEESRKLPFDRRMASSTKKPKHIFVFCIFGHSLVPPPPPYRGVHGGLFYATIQGVSRL